MQADIDVAKLLAELDDADNRRMRSHPSQDDSWALYIAVRDNWPAIRRVLAAVAAVQENKWLVEYFHASAAAGEERPWCIVDQANWNEEGRTWLEAVEAAMKTLTETQPDARQ